MSNPTRKDYFSVASSSSTDAIELTCNMLEEEAVAVEKEEEEQAYENKEIGSSDALYATDNESIQEEGLSYLKQEPLVKEFNFCEEFKAVLDINELSEDASEFEQFVDDINVTSSQSKLTAQTDEKIEVAERIPETAFKRESLMEDISEADFVISDLFGKFDEAFKEDKTPSRDEEGAEMLERYLEEETKRAPITMKEIIWQALEYERGMKELKDYIQIVLDHIVRKAVETVEYNSTEKFLLLNMDKRKLMHELNNKIRERQIANHIRTFLTEKIIEYCRRRGQYRFIRPQNIKTMEVAKRDYQNTLERFDQLLAKEADIIKVFTERENDLQNDLNLATEQTKSEVQKLEEMIRDTLTRDNCPSLDAYVEGALHKMSLCRQEVANVRFQFLLQKHNQAILLEKLDKLENLADGLTMSRYDAVQSQTFALEKNFDERKLQLKNMHIAVHDNIHLYAHYKEKETMVRNDIRNQRLALDELLEQKYEMRKEFHFLKLEHIRLRKEINDISFSGGLLDKPALLRDYDKTCRKVEKMRELVAGLRETYNERMKKLEALMSKTPTSSTRLWSNIKY